VRSSNLTFAPSGDSSDTHLYLYKHEKYGALEVEQVPCFLFDINNDYIADFSVIGCSLLSGTDKSPGLLFSFSKRRWLIILDLL